jgi:acetyl-CoA acyltransferase
MDQALIISGKRTAVTKANKGAFKNTRPDDLAIRVIQHLIQEINLDPLLVEDVIIGNAVPEAEQGLQIGRMVALNAIGIHCAGFTINRYCASGLEAIAIATAKINAGMADCIIAGGAESMSLVPTVGWKTVPNYNIANSNPDYYLSMGLTAEAVANEYKISREDQDLFALQSHQLAVKAIQENKFKSQILPIQIEEIFVDNLLKKKSKIKVVDQDEGPRENTSIEVLQKLKPVFAAKGSVTAGNSSQTSDGAAFVLLMSEKLATKLNLHPIGKLLTCQSVGVHPRIMGMGPVGAINAVLKNANLHIQDIDLFEINEAFASQSIAVINELKLDKNKVNVNGGAIALGHPLGCSGAKLSIQLFHELKLQRKKLGIVSACVGGGQGIAGIFEAF